MCEMRVRVKEKHLLLAMGQQKVITSEWSAVNSRKLLQSEQNYISVESAWYLLPLFLLFLLESFKYLQKNLWPKPTILDIFTPLLVSFTNANIKRNYLGKLLKHSSHNPIPPIPIPPIPPIYPSVQCGGTAEV